VASPARAAEKVWRVGFLDGGREAVRRRSFEVFRRGMAERGYVEGNNVVYDARYADGRFDRLPQPARELIALSPDALLVATTPAATVAKRVPHRRDDARGRDPDGALANRPFACRQSDLDRDLFRL
jgi:hypothetical protein